MTPLEQQATFALSLIVSLRILGLMMVLPLFALSAIQYTGANHTLVGLALGAYGFTQAILQIPLGMLSDRVGRKPIMAAGLLMLALGSVVAASGHTMAHLLIGRILQGAGAIGSTAVACLADLTCEENRTKAMAILGMSIGLSFFLSMALGPVLNVWFSLAGIFWFTALLAFIATVIVYRWLPASNPLPRVVWQGFGKSFNSLLRHKPLLKLNLGVCLLHALLSASFIALPLLLQKTLHLNANQQWQVYVPGLLLAFTITLGLIHICEKKRKNNLLFLSSIVMICLSEGLLALYSGSKTVVIASLFSFLTVFSLLEALLPSMASKAAPPEHKGTAMGTYSSFQFLGIFVGGTLGGLLQHYHGSNSVFLFSALLGVLLYINFIRK